MMDCQKKYLIVGDNLLQDEGDVLLLWNTSYTASLNIHILD